MSGLLISVRSAEEAERALAGGADVIDVKEPRRGSLGAADASVWREVAALVGRRALVTAALGELLTDPVRERAAEAGGLRLVKIGLAGCHGERRWTARWFDAAAALPAGVHPVPVAYADWPSAGAPSPSVALALAELSPARLLLVDTHDKTRGGLLAHYSREGLAELAAQAGAAHVRLALAGSLDAEAIAQLLPLAPAYFGVRGAACREGREGTIDLGRVKALAALVHRAERLAAV